jgi:hypothetical protein
MKNQRDLLILMLVACALTWTGCTSDRGTEATTSKPAAVSPEALAILQQSLLTRGARLQRLAEEYSTEANTSDYAALIRRMADGLRRSRELQKPTEVLVELNALGVYAEWLVVHERVLRDEATFALEVKALRAELDSYRAQCGPLQRHCLG